MAESPASTLSIEELTGAKAGISLRNRALPYRPITFGGKQRVEFSWYPGSPIATAQVLGPEEEPFTIRGFWKEKFLFDAATKSTSLDLGEGSARIGFSSVSSVLNLVNYIDRLRRRGQLCRFSWEDITRDGHITSFQQTWHNRYDCEWELEFSPISQGETPPQQTPTPVPVFGDVSQSWETLSDRITTVSKPPFNLSNITASALSAAEDYIIGYSNAVKSTVDLIVANALAPTDAINRISAIADGMKIRALQVAFDITDRATESLFPVLSGNTVNNVLNPFTGQPVVESTITPETITVTEYVAARVYQNNLKTSVRDLRNYAVSQQAQYADLSNPQLLQTFIATQDTDLRDVSTQFYGTPNQWRLLMTFNHLSSSKLTAGMLIFVPDLGNASDQLGVAGGR